MKSLIIAVACLALSGTCQADNLRLNDNFLKSITEQTFTKNWYFPSETAALKYFAAVCIRNRNTAFQAIKTLRINGYVMFAKDKETGSQYWQSTELKPIFILQRKGPKLISCATFVGKATQRISNLESLLDELTVEDIQRVPKNPVRYARGERGWVLRPGFEHAIFVQEVPNSPGLSGISLVALD